MIGILILKKSIGPHKSINRTSVTGIYMKQRQKQQRNELISIVIAVMLVLPLLTFSLSFQTQRADATSATGGSGGNAVTGANGGVGGTVVFGNANGGNILLPRAPVAITGDNIYIAWWTNNTENGNDEVMFRASTDAGQTFGDKINLSNSSEAASWRVEIDSDADNVVVTWWETNQTSDTPVMRVSNDNGATFGPMLRLATNGTIESTAEEEVAAEAGEL
jgi:hypothetical protein